MSSTNAQAENIRTILRAELERRVQNMPLKDLLQELADEAPRAVPPVKTSRPPSMAPNGQPHTMKLQTAVVDVFRGAEKPLNVVEVIARVQAIRPGSLESSIRSEVSKARKAGFIKLTTSTVRGGEYIASGKSEMRLRRTG